MKFRVRRALLLVSTLTFAALASLDASGGDIKKGDSLQTLVNLHPDMGRHVLFTLNYQQAGLIPVCSEVKILKVGSKKLAFEYEGQMFELGYEGFTAKAGISFQQAAKTFLGSACDRAQMQSLGKLDQDGIRRGRPEVGMTRAGLLFALGRPPYHANPNLDGQFWMYWKNRYAKMEIEFGADDKVTVIR